VLLLEDGIPLAYAPYGDNSSYYHPPSSASSASKCSQGSGQIAIRPHTVVRSSKLTSRRPCPPNQKACRGHARQRGLPRGARQLRRQLRQHRFIAHGTYKETTARRNMNFRIYDLNLKSCTSSPKRQALTFRSSYYTRLAGHLLGPHPRRVGGRPAPNPFANDHMYAYRWGTSATHRFELNPATTFLTNAYYTTATATGAQSSNRGSAPTTEHRGGLRRMANLDTTCGNEGRRTTVLERGPRARVTVEHACSAWTRPPSRPAYHHETSTCIQANGDFPDSREPAPDRTRVRKTVIGTVTRRRASCRTASTSAAGPHAACASRGVDYERIDNLLGTRGETSIDQWIPGSAPPSRP